MSVRLKLTLSYAGFVMLAGGLLLATVWVFLLRYVPEVIDNPQMSELDRPGLPVMVVPNRSDLLRAFAPRASAVLALLLIFGLLGGWILAGRMLAPLARITSATRVAADGSLSHRIRMEGRKDEFRELSDAFDSMLAQLEANVAEQQRFAANASHELRTPLAISRMLLDVARNDPKHDSPKIIERLHAAAPATRQPPPALRSLPTAVRTAISHRSYRPPRLRRPANAVAISANAADHRIAANTGPDAGRYVREPVARIVTRR